MDVETDPEFWKWLRDKARKESEPENAFEPVPLYIHIEKPQPEPGMTEAEETPFDSLNEYDIDYSVDY